MEYPQRLVEDIVAKKDFLSVIIGMLYGDGSINKKYPSTLTLCQSGAQKEYLEYKIQILQHLGLKACKMREMHCKNREPAYIIDFTDQRIKWFYEKFYDADHKRKVNISLLRHLTPIGLAIWYMDDGNLVFKKDNDYAKDCSAFCLNTQAFSYADHLLLVKFFKKKFRMEPHINKDKKYNKLYFPAKYAKDFFNLIRPYIPSTMDYKIR